ncbi:hypothetical protein Tco_0701960 [Tanacetum coccineum]|uniref:Retrovirus-related Pol polyprotein from transposon TNT 1-94 n=1 Tax=Tanacetum coccineum TaxID=301880 RepID=A0ABQ4XUY1_9ASTR
MKTPMSSDTKLIKDKECESIDSTKYRGMMGSLLYLTASRPDVCLCARLLEDPKTSHLEAVKGIFRYIKGTTHLGLWYPKGTNIKIVVYADSDHVGNYVDRKSTSGICTFVGCCLTSWFSKKQTALAISTTEAEYVTMPRKTAEDHQNTKSYILIISHEYTSPLREMLINLENRCIHEGRVVFPNFDYLFYVESMFSHIGFDCLLKINEKICPRFILEFYSQYRVNYTLEGKMLIEFVIQNRLFSYTIEEFGQILGIPFNGACSFTDKWSLDDLRYSVPMSGPYQTNPPCPDEIKNYIQDEREGPVTHIRHDKVIDVEENQILTREIVSIMKSWVEIIQENVFCLGGNQYHVSACLCHMLYCIAKSEHYNIAYFMAKRIVFVTKQPRLILPYGMLLTRLFKYVISVNPKLSNGHYVLYDRVMYPLATQQERKTRKDYDTRRGRSSTSSSSAFGQPSSSHPNEKRTSRASTPSLTRFVNQLTNEVPRVFSNPPNIDPDMEPFYTRQIEILNCQVQLRDEQRGGIRSIGKGIKNFLKGKKKK